MVARAHLAAQPTDFTALDACHRDMLGHLQELTRLVDQVQLGEPGPQMRRIAGHVEHFFSAASRAHHAQEEETVFPALLECADANLVATVRTLQQDHGWIEENWLALAPQLRAIASGNGWVDPAEFQHAAALFVDLCRGHIALEETLIYPESKARWAQAVAARRNRQHA